MSFNSLEIRPVELNAGEVELSGFKHLAVLLMAASVLVPSTVTIDNVPLIDDVVGLKNCILELGGNVEQVGRQLIVDARGVNQIQIPEEISSRLHGPLYLVPTLLGRFGKVSLGTSGGCPIGEKEKGGCRPVRNVTEVLERFGARFEHYNYGFVGQADGFHAVEIDILDWSDHPSQLSGPLVSGATKTAILAAASVQRGTTIIRNPDCRSEVNHLLSFLRQSGMQIMRDATILRIEGTPQFSPMQTRLMTDLIEVVTYTALAVCTGTSIRLVNITCKDVIEGLRHELKLLRNMGVKVKCENDSIVIISRDTLYAFEVDPSTQSIYSDSHPFFALMALRGDGISRIREHVWHDRFAYVQELIRLGARMEVEGNELSVFPSALHSQPCTVVATDVRGAAVLMLAAFLRSGPTRIEGVQHLNRGYDDLINKLRRLGADIVEI
jgi:UDP-N-acetylglucosamine 1-carboxyvinyltransferase